MRYGWISMQDFEMFTAACIWTLILWEATTRTLINDKKQLGNEKPQKPRSRSSAFDFRALISICLALGLKV